MSKDASPAVCGSISETELCEKLQQKLSNDEEEEEQLPESQATKKSKIEKGVPIENKPTNPQCLLLEDTSQQCTPRHVAQLLDQYRNTELQQAEILLLLIYVVALESGFSTQQEYAEHIDDLHILPSTTAFHSENLQLLTRQRPTYNDEANKSIFRMQLHCIVHHPPNLVASLLQSRLMAYATGDLMIVTLSPAAVDSDGRGYSVCLSIGRYVLNMQAKNKPLYTRFRKLNDLTLQLRNSIFVPMRAQQSMHVAPIFPALHGLPPELYDGIFRYLSKNQLKIVANVNRLMNNCICSSKYRGGST